MIETWFTKLFKFKPFQYAEGEIAFQSGFAFYFFVILILIIIFVFIIIYRRTKIYPSQRNSMVSLILRISAIVVLCFPLLEPVLIVPDIIPKENFLVVLADKSASMSIEDGYFGKTRDDDAAFILNNSENGILPELDKNFKVRNYTFGEQSDRVDSLVHISPEQTNTNISRAFKRIASDFKGMPLIGILMLTDGADNSLEDPYEIAEELGSLNIPIHIVGIGSESFEQERELLSISTKKGLDQGSGAEIDIKVRSWVEETDLVTFNIFKAGEKVFSEKKYLKGNGKIDYFTFFYETDKPGAIEYTFQIDQLDNEINTKNNSLNMLIDSIKDTIRVLYFEGQLRSDFKFIKRALEADPVFQFTSVSRTGNDKYYKQGIQNPAELANGFPVSEEELYRFKAIIFGDIESSYFSNKQLNMIENFVRLRGGGFLMLGGKNSFSESNYWNSAISDILPVELDLDRKMNSFRSGYGQTLSDENKGFKFLPTPAGLESPILKLASQKGANWAIWNEMPDLTSINYFGEVKPGATVLAIKPKDHLGGEEPLLVVQRYGKGRSAVLGTASTWRWKLMVDAANNRHQRFWQQMARWLVASALDNVNIEIPINLVEPGKILPIRATVFDDDYNAVGFAKVMGTITDPLGQTTEINFYPELTIEGGYKSSFLPREQGLYTLVIIGTQNNRRLGSDRQTILVRSSKKEYYNASLKREFLENISKLSGGMYYNPNDSGDILLNLKTRKAETSVTKTEYLWDMPFIFIFAVLLLAAEWIYRRRKGLP